MTELKIDQEFKQLIPALQPEEYVELKKSILAEGCRDAIITWNGTIIDGHNRYEICTNWMVDYKTVEKEFASRDDAKIWMIINQFARRNITSYQRSVLALQLEPLISAKAKEKEHERKTTCQKSDKSSFDTIDTKKIIAKQADVSHDTIAKVKKIEKTATPEVKAKLSSGELSINQVYKDIQKDERTKEIAEQRQVIAAKGQSVEKDDRWNVYHGDLRTWKPTKQYDWIITDPPYPKEFLPLWEVLAERAKEWLKPGGLILAMSGQMYLDEIYEMMSKHLTYYWTGSYLTPGQPTPLRQRNINTTWKPILIYSNGDYKGKIFGDVWKSEGNDKDNHKWGQSVSGMFDIISKVCLRGESILDPFCGAGTTGVAAIKHGCFFDGLELELENVNISKGRLSE